MQYIAHIITIYYAFLNVLTGSECLFDNGGCEQICIDTYLSNECDCEVGYVLAYNGTSCSRKTLLLFMCKGYSLINWYSLLYNWVASNCRNIEILYVFCYTAEPVELAFTGDTPMVTGHNVSVQIYASPPRHLRCQLISRDAPGMPIRTAEEIC